MVKRVFINDFITEDKLIQKRGRGKEPEQYNMDNLITDFANLSLEDKPGK